MSWELPEAAGSFACVPAAATDPATFNYWLLRLLECSQDVRQGFEAYCEWVRPHMLRTLRAAATCHAHTCTRSSLSICLSHSTQHTPRVEKKSTPPHPYWPSTLSRHARPPTARLPHARMHAHPPPRPQIRHLFYSNLGRADVTEAANAAAPFQCLCTYATTRKACATADRSIPR